MKSFTTFSTVGLLLLITATTASAQNPFDRDWTCNSILKDAKSFTVTEIGACQGVSIINNKLYFYGDRYDLSPRIGVIREFTLNMKPTGRRVVLHQGGKPIMTHPTGIAYLDKNNVFIGNTVNQQAKIFLIDWEKAWSDGDLDNAIKSVVEDDLAINGCRPLMVSRKRKRLIATADYGAIGNQLRFYDPQKLAAANKTSEAGVLVGKFSCSAFNQNLDWNAETGQVVCIQNVVAGLGWRLQYIDVDAAESSKKELSKSALKRTLVFPAHSELEGFRVLPNGKMIFVTAHKTNNVWIGTPESIVPKVTRKGHELPFFEK